MSSGRVRRKLAPAQPGQARYRAEPANHKAEVVSSTLNSNDLDYGSPISPKIARFSCTKRDCLFLATPFESMVGEAGIEPTTPGLEGRCSIQLSYSPMLFIVASSCRKAYRQMRQEHPGAQPLRLPLRRRKRSDTQ